jgi:hypothetical protein
MAVAHCSRVSKVLGRTTIPPCGPAITRYQIRAAVDAMGISFLWPCYTRAHIRARRFGSVARQSATGRCCGLSRPHRQRGRFVTAPRRLRPRQLTQTRDVWWPALAAGHFRASTAFSFDAGTRERRSGFRRIEETGYAKQNQRAITEARSEEDTCP